MSEDFYLVKKEPVQFLIVHHSATSDDSTRGIQALIDNSQSWLTKEKRAFWRNQGYRADYHYYIDSKGEIHLGQPLNLNSTNAGNDFYNLRSIAICFVGEIHKHFPTREQFRAGVRLSNYLLKRFKTIIQVLKHSDIVSTNCPGTYFPWKEYKMSIGPVEILLRIKDEYAELNGKKVKLPIYPFIVEENGGHTMIPLRFIAEALGAEVSWDSVKKAIKIIK